MPTTFSARWIVPVSGPPIRDGHLQVENGRIVAIGSGNAKSDNDFGDAAILPGFVNAHTHFDLTGAAGKTPPCRPFTEWLTRVVEYRAKAAKEEIKQAIDHGVARSLQFGITTAANIEGQWLGIRVFWKRLRIVALFEVLGLIKESGLARLKKQSVFIDVWEQVALQSPDFEFDCQAMGYSPHSPYSLHGNVIEKSATMGKPIAIHIAESPEETQLLETHDGPFKRFLENFGVWNPDGLVASHDELLKITEPAPLRLLIHANYLLPQPLPSTTTIVYCPRTHAAFGWDPHPFQEFMKLGVRVAVGTDSLASNPDLSVLNELRFIRERYPDLPAETILHMGTLAGAEALGMQNDVGSLELGKWADFTVVPIVASVRDDVAEQILQSSEQPSATYVAGEKVA